MFGQDDQGQQGFGGQQDDHQQSQATYMDGITQDAPMTGQPQYSQPQQDDNVASQPTPQHVDDGALQQDVPLVQNDLLDIKQSALEQLVPLVSHLEQSSEDKFKTTMMMIQASDDSTLVRVAYTAAQGITDDAERAQALLDIVNEINYFTSSN